MMVNESLREEEFEGDSDVPLLKEPLLDSDILNKLLTCLQLFLRKEKIVEKMQKALNETDYLDLLQSGFRPGFSTETAPGCTWRDLVRGSALCFISQQLLPQMLSECCPGVWKLLGSGRGGTERNSPRQNSIGFEGLLIPTRCHL